MLAGLVLAVLTDAAQHMGLPEQSAGEGEIPGCNISPGYAVSVLPRGQSWRGRGRSSSNT
jgi:hypothetical protein